MSDPFVSEIQIFGFNFAPKNWAFCSGQVLPISQNTALFALLGTTYGGDGKSTFALPNLSSCTACGPGQGPGLSLRDQGELIGSQGVALLQSEIPSHTHTASAYSQTAPGTGTGTPVNGGALSLIGATTSARTYTNAIPNTTMAPQTIAPTGGSQPHENRQPYLGLNFCIALQGVFPPRS